MFKNYFMQNLLFHENNFSNVKISVDLKWIRNGTKTLTKFFNCTLFFYKNQ